MQTAHILSGTIPRLWDRFSNLSSDRPESRSHRVRSLKVLSHKVRSLRVLSHRVLGYLLAGLVVVAWGVGAGAWAQEPGGEEPEVIPANLGVGFLPLASEGGPAVLLVWTLENIPESVREEDAEAALRAMTLAQAADNLWVRHPRLVLPEADEAARAALTPLAEELREFSGTLTEALELLAEWGYQPAPWEDWAELGGAAWAQSADQEGAGTVWGSQAEEGQGRANRRADGLDARCGGLGRAAQATP